MADLGSEKPEGFLLPDPRARRVSELSELSEISKEQRRTRRERSIN